MTLETLHVREEERWCMTGFNMAIFNPRWACTDSSTEIALFIKGIHREACTL